MLNLKPNRAKAIFLAKKVIAQIVTDVVNLEDINYTVPEIQTLLDGITVGGHSIQDELIALNQINAWQYLFNALDKNNFIVSYDFCTSLHKLVAKDEALEYGVFRSGAVSISGTKYLPPNNRLLKKLWDDLANQANIALDEYTNNTDSTLHIYELAINLFAKMSKTQFFYDGNKRTARMMMTGILLSNGYPMINVPAKRKTEFNQIMINYYNDDNQLPSLHNFMLSCLESWLINEFTC